MQARSMKYFMAACGVVAVMACADDRQASNPTMPITRLSAVVLPTGCDFTVMKQDAKGYFRSGNDPVYTLIQNWSGSNRTKPDTTFKRQGFDVLAYVGQVAGNSAVVTADTVAGDTFVRDVATCLGFVMPAGTFTSALGGNGMFAVPVASDAVTSRGTPLYGVEPTATWVASTGQARFLMYGAPTSYNSFSNEQAALDPAAGAYDLNTLPAHLTFSPPIHGGTCADVTSGNTVLQHEQEILAPVGLTFCPTGFSSSRGSERGVFALARRLSEWLAPRPAYATTLVLKTPGGSLGGLSPIGPVVVNGATVKIAFVVEPSNGTINKDIKPPIVVSAKTANDTPLDGVSIKLTVYNNQGTPVKFSGDSTATTAGGLATFDHFQTTKAGGYTIVATGTIFGTTTKADTSTLFNVQGKK
jgi:hypothetical protein